MTTLPFADALTPMLGRLRARYQQSRLPGFLDWWFGELRGLLPQRWQAYLRVQQTQLLLRRIGDVLHLEAAEGGSTETLGQIHAESPPGELQLSEQVGAEAARAPRILLLPADAVLVRRLSFPAAAAGNVRSLVGFEIDRQTPFRADQVEYDCRLLPAEKGARQVSVELAVVTRERLASELAGLGELAQRLDAVDVAREGGRAGFNLLPPAQRRPHDHRPMLINLALVAFSASLLLLAMGQLVENRREAVAQVEAEVEARRVEARRTAQLRKTLEEAATAANFLAEHKAQRPTTISLLRDLTDILPDDTFLERLTITGADLSLTVQSGSAAKLIGLFQTSGQFADPTLLGAVQPDSRTGKDRATLTVKAIDGGEGGS
ncbi:PilN domain-containing protein [Pseudomarimonas salicorniae]|uniref:Fimbrial assembly protein n=1 Tax=Pseudomarimonas salicorniae TaxID=2933270 RepID=A0ABT0GJ39_9GAMM|nr:PilN domain-containing protein [Lysobacter sp. CAU 1642]MCK7594579.1 fimbrial assembly protein [Lysobacter sp. CAU 1642]